MFGVILHAPQLYTKLTIRSYTKLFLELLLEAGCLDYLTIAPVFKLFFPASIYKYRYLRKEHISLMLLMV